MTYGTDFIILTEVSGSPTRSRLHSRHVVGYQWDNHRKLTEIHTSAGTLLVAERPEVIDSLIMTSVNFACAEEVAE